MKATHLKLYSLKLSFENKLYFLSTEINTCLLSNIGMNHQHRPKCYTEYISLLTISSVNKQEYRWLTDAICREQTLIQIYKCKCTVSWHRMSNHTSGKQLWESKIFLSVGVTKIPPPPMLGLLDIFILQNQRNRAVLPLSSAGQYEIVKIPTEVSYRYDIRPIILWETHERCSHIHIVCCAYT